MDTRVLPVNNFEVKQEKNETSEGPIPQPDNLSRLKNFANIIEEGFQYHFVDLEEYLTRLLDEQNYGYSPGLGDEEKISMAKAKAKEYFKNYANEVFRDLKHTVEKEQLHHILPQSYINKLIQDLKSNLELNLQILSEEIIEGIVKHETSSIDDSSKKISKAKKGKTKIPKKALTILKNWLTEHFQDPYPSHTEKLALAKEAGISFKQVQNWFTNARGRVWKKSYNPEKFSVQIQDVLVEKEAKPKEEVIKEVQDVKNNINNLNYIPYTNYTTYPNYSNYSNYSNYPLAKPLMQQTMQSMQPTYILASQFR